MKSILAFSFVLTFLAGCAANHPPAVVPTTGSITGQVVDSHHNGVPSTSIILLGAGKKPLQLAETVTDDDGNFILNDVTPGTGMSVNATRRGTSNSIHYYGNLAPQQGMTSIRSGVIESAEKTNVTVIAGKVTSLGIMELTAAHAK